MPIAELDAFTQECAALEQTLAGAGGDDWRRPALGEWSLAQLVAHITRGASRVAAYLEEPVEGPRHVDRVEYWRYDADAEAPAIAERARREAAQVDPQTLPDRFTEAWRRSAERAGGLPPDHLIATIRGPMRLDDYLSTRVVEMVLHHLDLTRALDKPPSATPAASRMTMHVLEELLGGPRPRNLGRTRFLLVASGRLPTDDPRFPVLR